MYVCVCVRVARVLLASARALALAAIVALMAIGVVQEGLLNGLARQWIVRWADRQLDADVQLVGVSVSLLSGGLAMEGLRLLDPAAPGQAVLAFDEVGLNWRWDSLAGDQPLVLTHLTAVGGAVCFYRRRDGTYSFQKPRTAASTSRPRRDPSSAASRRAVQCQRLRLIDVAVRYEDHKHPLTMPLPPFRVQQLEVTNLALPGREGQPPGAFQVEAGIDGDPRARLHSAGEIRPLRGLPLVTFTLEAQHLPLPPLNRLFAHKLPFLAESGWLDFQAQGLYHDESIHDGRAHLWLREIREISLNPDFVREADDEVVPGVLVARLRTAANWYLPAKFSRQIHKLKWRPRWLELRPLDPPATGPDSRPGSGG